MIVLISSFPALSQDVSRTDSLIQVYHNGIIDDSLKIIVLDQITLFSPSPDQMIKYGNILIKVLKDQKKDSLLANINHRKGVAYRHKGELEKALKFLFIAAELSNTNNYPLLLSETYTEIATCYSSNNDGKNAFLYNEKAIEITREIGDLRALGMQLINLGYKYFKVNDFANALKNYDEADSIFTNIVTLPIAKAYTLGNRALVFWKQENRSTAKHDLFRAIAMLEPLGDQYGMADFNNQLGTIYLEEGKTKEAILYTERGLKMAVSEDLKEQVRDASLVLSKLYQGQKDFKKAYTYQNQYIAYKDSIQSQETTQRLADLRTAYEVGQKQAELDVVEAQQAAERKQSMIIGSAMAAVLILIGFIAFSQYKNSKQKQKTNKILANQKQELEQLNHTKDRFFSIISHDLRGPVNAFAGISKLIKMYVKRGKVEEINEMAGDIDESAGRLSSLLDNLLEWAVQQQGQFPYAPEKVNFQQIANELIKTFETTATGKEIKLYSKIDQEVALFVDKNSTTTIFRNLVGNALKFTPEGGEVFFESELKGEIALLKVTDTGVGIPKDKFDELFALNEKKSTAGTSGEKGLGLGLQLAYEFTEMNKGSIRVESEEGVGTTFTVELPLGIRN